MAETKRTSWADRASIGQFLWGVVIWLYENSGALAAALGSGGVMYYLASVTSWLNAWGPVAWGAAGILGFSVVLGVLMAWRVARAWAISREAMAKFTASATNAAAVNPLSKTFDSARINLLAFYHPFFQTTENAVIRDCEVYGPGAAYMLRTQLFDCEFNDCEVVITRSEIAITGLTAAFRQTRFERTKFYRVTFYMNAETARDFKKKIAIGTPRFPIITDGTYGTI